MYTTTHKVIITILISLIVLSGLGFYLLVNKSLMEKICKPTTGHSQQITQNPNIGGPTPPENTEIFSDNTQDAIHLELITTGNEIAFTKVPTSIETMVNKSVTVRINIVNLSDTTIQSPIFLLNHSGFQASGAANVQFRQELSGVNTSAFMVPLGIPAHSYKIGHAFLTAKTPGIYPVKVVFQGDGVTPTESKEIKITVR